MMNPEGYGGWRRDSVRQVDIITGCFLLIKRDLWEKLEGFDERFFMYAEEADLCYRAQQMGVSRLFTPDAKIVHYTGVSERVISKKTVTLLCGKTTFMRKHWSPFGRFVGVSILKLNIILRFLASFVLLMARRDGQRVAANQQWKDVWTDRHVWTQGYPRRSE